MNFAEGWYDRRDGADRLDRQEEGQSCLARRRLACLPYLFQAVEIDGVPYWDGGFMGNPALFPLFNKTACPDIVIVQINPVERDATPRSAADIQDRLNEITFNGDAGDRFVNWLIDLGKLSRDECIRPFVPRIDGGCCLEPFSASSKLDATWSLSANCIGSGGKPPSNGLTRPTIRSGGKALSICGWPIVDRPKNDPVRGFVIAIAAFHTVMQQSHNK
jgi:hypothetical protein